MTGGVAHEPGQCARCLRTERGRGDQGGEERKPETTDGGGHGDLGRRTLPAIYCISSWSERFHGDALP
jgi:hypothetical protein